MKENLPQDARIYSNNKLAVYYADRGVEANLDILYSLDILNLFIKTNEIRTYDYIAIVANTNNYQENLARQTLGYHFGKPLKVFSGENSNNLFVFSTEFQDW